MANPPQIIISLELGFGEQDSVEQGHIFFFRIVHYSTTISLSFLQCGFRKFWRIFVVDMKLNPLKIQATYVNAIAEGNIL